MVTESIIAHSYWDHNRMCGALVRVGLHGVSMSRSLSVDRNART